MTLHGIVVADEDLARFCRANQIARLSLFGSILRDDFGPESDIDVLVEFEPDARVGMIRLSLMELELAELFRRKVDLNTPGFISVYCRERVMAEAVVQYDAA